MPLRGNATVAEADTVAGDGTSSATLSPRFRRHCPHPQKSRWWLCIRQTPEVVLGCSSMLQPGTAQEIGLLMKISPQVSFCPPALAEVRIQTTHVF